MFSKISTFSSCNTLESGPPRFKFQLHQLLTLCPQAFDLSEPWFPHQHNEDNNINFTGMLGGFKEIMHREGRVQGLAEIITTHAPPPTAPHSMASLPTAPAPLLCRLSLPIGSCPPASYFLAAPGTLSGDSPRPISLGRISCFYVSLPPSH